MGLRTAEQYKASLRDGRAVFFRGDKVTDVTAHPVIGIAVEHAALDYRMAEDPQYRELAVIKDGADEYSRYYHLPRNGDDLLKRSALIAASTREGATLVVLIKEIGTDALFALHIVAEEMAKRGKPEYRERVRQYYRLCRDRDYGPQAAGEFLRRLQEGPLRIPHQRQAQNDGNPHRLRRRVRALGAGVHV